MPGAGSFLPSFSAGVLLAALLLPGPAAGDIRIGTYNIEYGAVGEEAERIAVLRQAKADIIGIQEANSWASLKAIADSLGYQVYGPRVEHRFTFATAILSRFPLVGSVWYRAGGAYRTLTGAAFALPGGDTVALFSLHLEPSDASYRETQMALYRRKIAEWQSRYRCLVVGDFNSGLHQSLEPQHLFAVGGGGIDRILADTVFKAVPGTDKNWGNGGSDHALRTVDLRLPGVASALRPRERSLTLEAAPGGDFVLSPDYFAPSPPLYSNDFPPTASIRLTRLPARGALMRGSLPADTVKPFSLDGAEALRYRAPDSVLGWDSLEFRAFDGRTWSGRTGKIRFLLPGPFRRPSHGGLPWAQNPGPGLGWVDMARAEKGLRVFSPYESPQFDSLPQAFRGMPFFRTGGGFEGTWGADQEYLRFTLSRAATLHIAFDPRAAAPAWLTSEFSVTPHLSLSVSGRRFHLYRKDFPAGEVVLKGAGFAWEARNAAFNYIVFASEGGAGTGIRPVPKGRGRMKPGRALNRRGVEAGALGEDFFSGRGLYQGRGLNP